MVSSKFTNPTSSTLKQSSGRCVSRAEVASHAPSMSLPLGKRVVVVHVFTKKTQKTPRREIETALKRAKEVQ